ncbi:uncharacterized protein V6R79_026446 [Siganus canaliculatus]
MGNLFCPLETADILVPLARDICPFPDYTPNPLVVNMLSTNSSLHLKNHYMAVQSSLSPKQLEDFTQGLRSTFGREGKVTLGEMGIVALSLAVLFDTLAKQVRGEFVPDSGPIPGLFLKDMRGYYPPPVYTVSRYLRLVPFIANNPARMKEETVRCHKQLVTDYQSLDELGENHALLLKEDITKFNLRQCFVFDYHLRSYHSRIKKTTEDDLNDISTILPDEVIVTLNCDLETSVRDFLIAVQKSDNRTQEAFQSLKSDESKTWLEIIALLGWYNGIVQFISCESKGVDSSIAQTDFDLKANALGKWPQ